MRFTYKGSDAAGLPVRGETSADSPREATDLLREQGIEVTELKPVGPKKLRIPSDRIDTAEVATFCEQLAHLTGSGMPLPDALEAVARDASSGQLRDALERFAAGVREGRDLADMLEAEKKHFPPLLTALVRAGQKTGKLAETLRLAGTHLWQLSALRDRVRSAVAYPAMVFILCCVVGSIVFLRVVPHFQATFEEMDLPVSGLTEAVLFIGEHFPIIAGSALALIVLLIVLFRYVNEPPEWVRTRRRILFQLPLVGRVLHSAFLCRFCRLASLLLKSGCGTGDTLDLLSELEKERLSHAGGQAMAEAVRNGRPLSDAMRARLNMFPELLVWMVESCETSGRLPEGFAEAAEIYRRETERNVELLDSILPGVLLFVVGTFIGLTVSALFGPLISLMGSLS